MYETASKRVYKSKRCVLFMTFRPSQRTLFMARRNWVLLALTLSDNLMSAGRLFYSRIAFGKKDFENISLRIKGTRSEFFLRRLYVSVL